MITPTRVTHLFSKPARGAPMQPCAALKVSPEGIDGGQFSPPLRHLLLLSATTLADFSLRPGNLRENLVLSGSGLDVLDSGTIVQVGTAQLRLTFQCEPCGQVAPFARPASLIGRRGILASVWVPGRIEVGDVLTVQAERCGVIPYKPADRVAWYLEQSSGSVDALALLWAVGLGPSYARALPSMLRRLGPSVAQRVRFKKDG